MLFSSCFLVSQRYNIKGPTMSASLRRQRAIDPPLLPSSARAKAPETLDAQQGAITSADLTTSREVFKSCDEHSAYVEHQTEKPSSVSTKPKNRLRLMLHELPSSQSCPQIETKPSDGADDDTFNEAALREEPPPLSPRFHVLASPIIARKMGLLRNDSSSSSLLRRSWKSSSMSSPIHRGMSARFSNEDSVESSLNMVPPSFHVATSSVTEEDGDKSHESQDVSSPDSPSTQLLSNISQYQDGSALPTPQTSPYPQRKVTGNWRRLMELNKITSMFKPQSYVAPPYVSFMPDQVTLHLINNHGSENLDLPATNAMQGAVMFADASGFTAMSQRLATKVSAYHRNHK